MAVQRRQADFSPLERTQSKVYETEAMKGGYKAQNIQNLTNQVTGAVEKERERRMAEQRQMLEEIRDVQLEAANYENLSGSINSLLDKHAKMMSEQRGVGAVLFGKDLSQEQELELIKDMNKIRNQTANQRKLDEMYNKSLSAYLSNPNQYNLDLGKFAEHKEASTLPAESGTTGVPFLNYNTAGAFDEASAGAYKSTMLNATESFESKNMGIDKTGKAIIRDTKITAGDPQKYIDGIKNAIASNPRIAAGFNEWRSTLTPEQVADFGSTSEYNSPLIEGWIKSNGGIPKLTNLETQKDRYVAVSRDSSGGGGGRGSRDLLKNLSVQSDINVVGGDIYGNGVAIPEVLQTKTKMSIPSNVLRDVSKSTAIGDFMKSKGDQDIVAYPIVFGDGKIQFRAQVPEHSKEEVFKTEDEAYNSGYEDVERVDTGEKTTEKYGWRNKKEREVPVYEWKGVKKVKGKYETVEANIDDVLPYLESKIPGISDFISSNGLDIMSDEGDEFDWSQYKR